MMRYGNLRKSLILLLFASSSLAYSQNQAFDYAFRQDFNDDPLGTYVNDTWAEDWGHPNWSNSDNGFGYILSGESNYLEIPFPKNSFFFDGSGVQWQTLFDKGYDELYFSYRIRISDGFQNEDLHAKLPGLSGGASNAGGSIPDGTDGWSGRYMLESGRPCVYLYHPELYLSYGDSYAVPDKTYYGDMVCFNVPDLTAGKWYVITQRIVMNTPGNHDGIVEGFINGKMVVQRKGIRFRDISSLMIDRIYFSNFLGGSGIPPTKDEYIDYDDFCAFQYADNMDVPRGNTPSPADRILILPYKDEFDQNWKTTLQTTTNSATSVSVSWQPYMFEVSYSLERKSESDAGFTKIASLEYDKTSYTDVNLDPSTSYTYRIIADGISTDEKSATTFALHIPAFPTNLNAQSINKQDISLTWSDNSDNETGFELYIGSNSSGDFTLLSNLSDNTVSYAITGLTPGTTYFFKIRSYNEDGNSVFSDVLQVTTIALNLPNAPTNLTATEIGFNSASLKWNDNANNERGYKLERTGPDNATKMTFNLAANSSSFADTGLVYNSSYTYVVHAFNDDGTSGYSQTLSVALVHISPPPAPSLLETKNFTDNSITIKWNDNSANESGFVVMRSPVIDLADVSTINVNANDTMYVDNNLAPNTAYVYTVQAINQIGNSPASNRKIASTLSFAETKRVKNGLIAYYNFGYNPYNLISDLSGYGEPLDLQILQPTSVQWNEFNRLVIKSNTTLVSTAPAKKIVSAIKETDEVTVECWIRPAEPFTSGDSRVVSLANNNNDIGFVIDQYYNSSETKTLNYGSRLSTVSTSQAGFPEIATDRKNAYLNLQQVVFSHDSLGNETVYINGEVTAKDYRSSTMDNWKDNFYLRLGNESDQSLPWTGTYYIMAIYNTALSPRQVKLNYAAGPCDSLLNNGMNYQMNIYPNPASEFVNIEISPDESLDYIPATTLRMQDLTGRLFYEESIFNPNISFSKSFDIRSFPKGMYIVTVISGKISKSAKFIVQ